MSDEQPVRGVQENETEAFARPERSAPRRRPIDLNFVLGIAIGTITFLAGIVILTGLYFPPAAPEVRYTCAVVLLLLSIYRMSVTIIRRRSHENAPEA
jgi:hypothetical protein